MGFIENLIPSDSRQATSGSAERRVRRRVLPVTALLAAAALAAGCGGNDSAGGKTSTAPIPAETVEIDGKSYTCDEITASECGDLTLAAFSRYKENLDQFVTTTRFGVADSYEDVAFAGLSACAYLVDGDKTEERFIGLMREYQADYEVSEVGPGAYFLPAWFEAQEILCPDLQLGQRVAGSTVAP